MRWRAFILFLSVTQPSYHCRALCLPLTCESRHKFRIDACQLCFCQWTPGINVERVKNNWNSASDWSEPSFPENEMKNFLLIHECPQPTQRELRWQSLFETADHGRVFERWTFLNTQSVVLAHLSLNRRLMSRKENAKKNGKKRENPMTLWKPLKKCMTRELYMNDCKSKRWKRSWIRREK